MSSYKNIAKSTGLIGFVQIIQIFFGVIRNKVIAVLIGTAGFGIWSLYNTYLELITQFSILGIDKSGVRQISKKTDDNTYIPKIIYVFRSSILVISILATIISIIFSKFVSLNLFKTPDYQIGVIIISFAILFNGISSGQKSILNGLRDLKGLALSQIASSIIGTIICIIAVIILGEKGTPFYIFTVALVSVVFTYRYSRKLNIQRIIPTRNEYSKELGLLLKLGLSFSVAGAIAAFSTYFSRIYLTTNFNIETVGIYQASWTISNLYVGMILGAMGVDLMPRLMKVIDDKVEINKSVNEQMELGMLVSSIGIVIIISFSSLLLGTFYSTDFVSGESIIRWQILGVSLRLLGFPLSYSIVAKEKVLIYIFIQTVFWISDFLLLILFSNYFGFLGLGINFFVSYIIYFFLSWFFSYQIFGFRPSLLLKKITLITYIFILTSFIVFYLQLPKIYKFTISSFLIIFNALWIIKTLKKEMNFDIKNLIKKIKCKFLKK